MKDFFVWIVVSIGSLFGIHSQPVTPPVSAPVQVVQTQSSTSVPLASNQNVESTNWPTYTDPEFLVKYPTGWTANKLTTQPDGAIFVAPDSGASNVNDFGAECAPTDTKNNTTAVVSAYTKLFPSGLQKTNVMIDGVEATRLSFVVESAPIHGTRILVENNGNTCDISESGSEYYQSQLFTDFYNSFKFIH